MGIKSNIYLLNILFSFVIILTVASCSDREERQRLEEKAILLEQKLNQRDSAFNAILTVMDKAEQKLDEIKAREKLVYNKRDDIEVKQTDQIISDLSLIDEQLLQAQNTIKGLSQKLDDSGLEIDAFKKRLASLNEKLKDRNESIKQLKKALADKNLQINNLESEVAHLVSERDQQSELIEMQVRLIDQKTSEINTAYFVVDYEKDLLEKGLIRKEGGFLGLGRTHDINPKISINQFEPIDKTITKIININSKKAELISKHPSDSYSFFVENDNVKYLKIENPEEFWKYTKYLVVSVKS